MGVASADSGDDQSGAIVGSGGQVQSQQVQPQEACTYHQLARYQPIYYVVQTYPSRPGFIWWEHWRVLPIDFWEREICGATITDTFLHTVERWERMEREERVAFPF